MFTGLPIPANAIFWMGFTAFLATHPHALPLWATLATIVALSLLMVCGLRMFSLKLHSLSPKSAWRQYLLVIAFLALVLLLGLAGSTTSDPATMEKSTDCPVIASIS